MERDLGSRDIDHTTRGARVRERDAIESIRPLADQMSRLRRATFAQGYGSPGATPKASPATAGRLSRRRGKQMSEGLIRSLSAFSLAKEDQVNENA
jgi:hypothetical protein